MGVGLELLNTPPSVTRRRVTEPLPRIVRDKHLRGEQYTTAISVV